MWRMTAPPWRPVAPVTSTVLSSLDMAQIDPFWTLSDAAAKLRGSLTRLLGAVPCSSNPVSQCREPQVELGSSDYFLESFEDFGVLGLDAPVHGHVFHRILAKKDQRVPDVVGLVNSFSHLLHH